MGIWQRIKERIRKGKQEEKTEETPDPELEERMRKIGKYCCIGMETGTSGIAKSLKDFGMEKKKAGEAIEEALKAASITEENVKTDRKLYGDQKEILNNWRKMHRKPMRRRWSNIVR